MIPVGTYPYFAVYDSRNGFVYVTNSGSDDVSVIDGVSNEVVATIPVGAGPLFATYDSGNGYIYVANWGSTTVSVINGATNKVVATVSVGSTPFFATYDSENGDVYVPSNGTSVVSVISGATNQVVATVPVGGQPRFSTYDSENGYVYVSNSGSANVSVIDGTTNKVVATISVGGDPLLAAYDSENGYLYVPNGNSANVSVVDGGTNTVVATVPVGYGPLSTMYDNGNGYVYVPDAGSAGVSVINGETDTVVATVPVGQTPFSPTYDSSNGYVYVPNWRSATVTVISGTTSTVVATVPVGSEPNAALYDSGNGYVYVTVEGAANVSVLGDPTYAVTFTESGLPLNTEWWVNVTGQLPESSTNATTTLDLMNRSYTYEVSTVNKTYLASGGSFIVDGSPVSEAVGFTQRTYPVTFTEAGLPAGTNWSVTVGASRYASPTSTITFMESNGTYPYALGPIAGWTPLPRDGTLAVDGGAASVAIAWSRVTYPVVFSATGLPSGTEWWINVTGGASNASTGDTLSLREPDGTYNYSVATADKTYSSQGLSFVVSGMEVSEGVTFSRVTYTVTFTETGLPTGTQWSVTFAVATNTGARSIAFSETPNGTYAFAVGTLGGYAATPSSGLVVVHGPPAPQTIAFKATTAPPVNTTSPSTFLGLPGVEGYAVLGALIAALAVLAAVAVLLGRRRKAPPEPAKTPGPPPSSP
jgi:YVTN family beta-propeller protein